MLELDESEKGLDLTKDEGIAYAYDWIRMQKRKKEEQKKKLKKLEKRLKKLTKDLRISDHVDFVGAVPHQKVAEYLQASQIYLSMSLSDGASTSLLEAMACGTFPIVSDIPANREWIVDGDNGFLVSPLDPKKLAQQIMEVFNNSSLMKTAAKKNVEIIQKRGILQKNLETHNLISVDSAPLMAGKKDEVERQDKKV